MNYLIFDENSELFDVLDFATTDDVLSYKKLNPNHSLQIETDLLSLEDTIFIEDEENFIDDDIIEW